MCEFCKGNTELFKILKFCILVNERERTRKLWTASEKIKIF